MTTVEGFLYSRLTADAAVSALVSDRVYPVKLPDNTPFPAISFQAVFVEQIENSEGSSGTAGPIFQIDCWSESPLQAKDLAEKVRLSLQGYRGTSGDLSIYGIQEWSSHDLFDSDIEIFHVSVSCRIWHSVAKPS